MFTTGRIIFVCVFIIVFIAGLAWSYHKERHITRTHFQKPYKILVAILLLLLLQFIIVKMRNFL